jgi:hypothetical protein
MIDFNMILIRFGMIQARGSGCPTETVDFQATMKPARPEL